MIRYAKREATALFKMLKYRVKDRASSRWLSDAAHAVNLCWNHCNAMQKHALKHNQRWPDAAAFQASTKGSSAGLGVPAQTVQAVCEAYLDRRRGSKKSKLRWRGKRSRGWVPFKNQTVRLNGATIHYHRRKIKLWLHRPVEGKIKSGSFSQDAHGRWYCNIVVEYRALPHDKVKPVGIDLGLKTLATFSNGEKINHPRVFYALEDKLAMAQRAGKKQLTRTIHARIRNTRKDFLHKETTKIANRFGRIMVGNASANWQVAMNGKAAFDASWGLFRDMLRYKAIARGAVYMDVPEAYTTQVCSACGALPEGRPKGIADLGIREWTCGDCGATHDRDVNAARNILRLGHQALAEGARPESHGDATTGRSRL